MSKAEREELRNELKELRKLVTELSSVSTRVHVAADRAISALNPEGDENGREYS